MAFFCFVMSCYIIFSKYVNLSNKLSLTDVFRGEKFAAVAMKTAWILFVWYNFLFLFHLVCHSSTLSFFKNAKTNRCTRMPFNTEYLLPQLILKFWWFIAGWLRQLNASSTLLFGILLGVYVGIFVCLNLWALH